MESRVKGKTLYLNGKKVPCVKKLVVSCDSSDVAELAITMSVSAVMPNDRKGIKAIIVATHEERRKEKGERKWIESRLYTI